MDADQMSQAVRTEIARRIPGIIESADLDKCTVKTLQRQLEAGLKRDLGEHTNFIRLTVRRGRRRRERRWAGKATRGIVDARWRPRRDARGREREVIGRSPGKGNALSRAARRRESAPTTRETRGLTVR